MNRRSITVILTLLLSMVLVDAAAAEEIKSRMKSRLPAINQMKNQGLVGEDNRGYLQFIAGQKGDEAAVNAENSDRQTVYAAIAQQQGASVAVVGQRRAAQIAEIAPKGHWLQSPDGKWYRK